MNHSSALRLLFCGLCCALTATACASSSTTPDAPAPAAPAAQPVSEAKPKPQGFCPEGAEELKRKNYRWCAKDSVPHGPFHIADNEGGLAWEGAFQDGQLHGEWTQYWSKSQPKWRATYALGKVDGEIKGWYEDGKEHYSIGYNQGVLDGTTAYLYPNGKPSATLHHKQGKPHGEWTYWHDNGQKAHWFAWKDNGRESIHKHWTRKGRKTQSPNGRLRKSKVIKPLEELNAKVSECYRHAQLVQPVAGKLVAQFSIDYSGDVSMVSLFDEDFTHNFMRECTTRQIEQMRFVQNPYGRLPIIRSWKFAMQ